MSREPMHLMATARRALILIAGVTMATSVASAQPSSQGNWRLGASTGGYAPRSALILAPTGGSNTRLGAGPSFSLDLQYLASRSVAVYANGSSAFSRITLGSSIRPTVLGPSDQVTILGGTAGVVLTPGSGWLKGHLEPTLRLGGGFKWYSFDLTDAKSQVRPTADLGLGFRGVGSGPIEVTAEVRYLLSSFDQAKLPTRGIAPQAQRQSDLILGIGIAIRP